jgi:hypothetical protein
LDVENDQSPSLLYPKATIKEIPDPDALSTPHDEAPEVIAELEIQEKCMWKPSSYVWWLHEGEGVTSARPSDGLLPKGIQEVAEVADEWEKVSVEEFVMATVTEASEGIMPLYEEARKCPDWPKWQEAIKAELQFFESRRMQQGK